MGLLTIVQPIFEVTADTMQPLVDAVHSGLTNLVPAGLGVAAAFIGLRLVKRIFYSFF